MSNDSQELSLIQLAAAGDNGALTILLRQSRRRLHDYVAAKIPSAIRALLDADDIVQETHTAAFRNVGGFEPRGEEAFFRWIATIALRKLRDNLRKHRADKRGRGQLAMTTPGGIEDSVMALIELVAGPSRTPSRIIARHEAVRRVIAELENLPETQRRAVWSVYIEQRPMAQIASDLGITQPAVRGLCHRGLERLRQFMGSASGFLSSSN